MIWGRVRGAEGTTHVAVCLELAEQRRKPLREERLDLLDHLPNDRLNLRPTYTQPRALHVHTVQPIHQRFQRRSEPVHPGQRRLISICAATTGR